MPRALDNALLKPLPSCNHAVSKSMFYTLSQNNKNSKVDINDPNPVAMVLHAMLSMEHVSNLSPLPRTRPVLSECNILHTRYQGHSRPLSVLHMGLLTKQFVSHIIRLGFPKLSSSEITDF